MRPVSRMPIAALCAPSRTCAARPESGAHPRKRGPCSASPARAARNSRADWYGYRTAINQSAFVERGGRTVRPRRGGKALYIFADLFDLRERSNVYLSKRIRHLHDSSARDLTDDTFPNEVELVDEGKDKLRPQTVRLDCYRCWDPLPPPPGVGNASAAHKSCQGLSLPTDLTRHTASHAL
jgi:hypothetical protein